MALILRGASIVNSEGIFKGDVRILGERVVAVGEVVAGADDRVVDLSGKYLLPGGIDAHTHFDLPLGDGTRSADNFFTGTRAAVSGGTTCIIDYATQFKGETLAEGVANWHSLADGYCWCDYSFHLAVTEWNEAVASEIPGIVGDGITSFKMYMAYKGNLQVDDGVLYEALKILGEEGALLCCHCENGDVILERQRELVRGGRVTPFYHPLSRPAALETESVNRLLTIAKIAEAPVYVVHVSASESMSVIIRARESGQKVYAETCPQYLYLDRGLYDKGFESAKYVCSPPLRDVSNQAGLWSAVANGLADVIATDHCSFNFVGQKDRVRDDFTRIPNGMPGVADRLPLMLKAAADGRISLSKVVECCSANPARIFGLYPRKGLVQPGADADFAVVDMNRRRTISAADAFGNVDYDPFEGYRVPLIESVYLRGQRLFDGGSFLTERPNGRYLKRRTMRG